MHITPTIIISMLLIGLRLSASSALVTTRSSLSGANTLHSSFSSRLFSELGYSGKVIFTAPAPPSPPDSPFTPLGLATIKLDSEDESSLSAAKVTGTDLVGRSVQFDNGSEGICVMSRPPLAFVNVVYPKSSPSSSSPINMAISDLQNSSVSLEPLQPTSPFGYTSGQAPLAATSSSSMSTQTIYTPPQSSSSSQSTAGELRPKLNCYHGYIHY